jgi:glycosyltransferase involved in cell wall biosynthesis
MRTRFSVLISLYKTNDPVFFEEALVSVFEQTYSPDEVVLVIDGEKTDAQQKVIDRFLDKYKDILKIVPLEKNIGQGPALNEGLKFCSHELVARMDTDDISKPYRFERQVAVFEQTPQIDVCGSWVDEFESDTKDVKFVRTVPEFYDEIVKYAKSRSPLNHPSVMYRKSKVLKCGGYELFGFLDDYLLWMKMLKDGNIFYNIQESLLFFRAANMYKRRSGIKYAMDSCKLQWRFYQLGMIGIFTFIKNSLLYSLIKILPLIIIQLIYKIFLRKKSLSQNQLTVR